jgi:hypothetical protein
MYPEYRGSYEPTWEEIQARRIRNLEIEEHQITQRLEKIRADLIELRKPNN